MVQVYKSGESALVLQPSARHVRSPLRSKVLTGVEQRPKHEVLRDAVGKSCTGAGAAE